MITRFAFGALLAMQAIVPTQIALAQNSTPPAASASTVAPAATGKVVGPESQPQPGVPVIVEGPNGKTHAFTDAKGDWSLYNLEPGQYQVRAAINPPGVANDAVEFTVKDRGVFGRIFGSAPSVVTTSAIKLHKDFAQ
jgi:hypothetical protein